MIRYVKILNISANYNIELQINTDLIEYSYRFLFPSYAKKIEATLFRD